MGARNMLNGFLQSERVTAPLLGAEDVQPRWYVAHTRGKHEKLVAQYLDHKSVECFLPLHTSIRPWKDRRKQLELPLFPGYVFVRIALQHRLQVLQAPGVVRLLANAGHPIDVPETQLEVIRRGLAHGVKAEPYPFLKAGQPVRIRSGPLEGLEGHLVRKKENLRFVISVDAIMRSMIVDVDACDVEAINGSCDHGARLLT